MIALHLWTKSSSEAISVWFGDNDGARYDLIKASASGSIATAILNFHLESEAKKFSSMNA